MKRLIALLLLLLVVASADASGYTLGSDGYYWSNGVAYTRTRYWQPGYGYGCHAVAGYYFYRYYPVATAYPSVQNITYQTPDWRNKLLELKKDQQEQQAFLQASREFGLTVPYQTGYAGGYSLSGTLNYGANASTLYGYGGHTYNSYAYQQPGTLDVNLLYQQAAQLAAQSQRLGGEATGSFQALAGQAGANQARVAEILARGQTAAQVLAALSLPPTQETRSFTFKIGPSGSIVPDGSQVPPTAKDSLFAQWKELAQAKCLKCHGAEQPKGGFNIGLFRDMTPEQKQHVVQMLTTPDDKKRMPRNEDGSPGQPLTPAELRLFVLN